MKPSRRTATLGGFVLAAVLPVAGQAQTGPDVPEAALVARADALIAQMTPQEKAGQLVHPFANYPDLGQAVARGEIGALAYLSKPADINRIQRVAVERSRLKIPLLFEIDVAHGFRTIFPAPIGLAASWDPAMIEQVQATAATEARAAGITVAFSPMVDITRDARWGRIVEGAGEDPYLGSKIAAAQIRGFQGPRVGTPGRLIATVKHFAGYGAAVGGRDYDEVNLSDSELRNVYLPPFKAAIDAGAGGLMNAYMALNGVPAAGNRWLLTDVLRGEWGFKGFVLSDADTVKTLVNHGFAKDQTDAAVRALDAGLDAELLQGRSALSELPKALAAGQISQATVDQAVRRVLVAKLKMGLFEHPYVDEVQAEAILSDPAHREQARIAAERSAVLLKNDGGLLPLDPAKLRSLAVIGPLAASKRDTVGNWVFAQQDAETIDIATGLRSHLGSKLQVNYAPGLLLPQRLFPSPFASLNGPAPDYTAFDAQAEFDKAVALARQSDVVVMVLGEAQYMNGEDASRSTFELPGDQQKLLEAVSATGKTVILLLMGARPMELRWAKEHVPAIMDVWYPGTRGGEAVANLLLGTVSPGGKLPFTWPRHVGQVPLYYGRTLNHQKPEDLDKRYWNEPSSPLYPFGYGLSYSSFAYSNLKVDHPSSAPGSSIKVSVDLTNTGRVKADETAQLYIHQQYGSASRPIRELKGFQRVTLRAGEKRTLQFTLGPDELRYWSSAAKGWVLEASSFDVWVGTDAAADLHTTFEVTSPPTQARGTPHNADVPLSLK